MGKYIVKARAPTGKIIYAKARDKRQANALMRIALKAGGKYISIRKSK